MNQTQSNLGWTTRKVKGKSGRIRVSPWYIFFFGLLYMHVYFLSLYVFCIFQLFAFFLSQLFFIRIPRLFREIFIIAVQNFERFSMKKKLKSSVMRLRWLPSHSLQIKANQISPEKQNNGWYYRNFLGSGINKKWPYLYVMTPKFTDHYYC